MISLDTANALRAAIAVLPSDSKSYVRLVQLDRENAEPLLEKALALNPYDASVSIELGLLKEAQGDYATAERMLVRAAQVDHTYLPEWTLLNFYARHDNSEGFWKAAHLAGQMRPTQPAGLYQMCWRMSPNAQLIGQSVVPDDYTMVRVWILFLLDQKELEQAGIQGARLVKLSPRNDARSTEILYETLDAQINNGQLSVAHALWDEMEKQQWIPAYNTFIYNSAFQTPFLQHGFGWKELSCDGVMVDLQPGNGLHIEFSGEQPEQCGLVENTVALKAGTYKFHYQIETDNVRPDTGVHWRIFNAAALNELLAQSSDLPSAAKPDDLAVTVPDGSQGVRLSLDYHRTVGTSRIHGSVTIKSVQLER